MSSRTRLAIALVVGGLGVGGAQAATYYVATYGNDATGNGSLAKPWRSPSKPKTVLRAGDTVQFRGGDYVITEPIYLNGNAGTASAPITYTSYPGETARIVFDRQVRLADITLHHVFHVARPFHVFQRLSVYQSPASRLFGTSITGDPKNDQYQRVGAFGIFAGNVTIRDTKIANMAGVGIYTDHGGRNALVENCSVTDTYSHSFYVAGPDGVYRANFLDGAKGYNNQQGIQIQWPGTTGNKVYNNVVRNSRAACVNFSGPVANNDVYNNILINCGVNPSVAWGSALAFWHQGGPVGPGNRFFNNTVFGNRPKASVIGTTDGQPVDIFNNIFSFNSAVSVGGGSGFRIHDNIFFNGTSMPSGNRAANPKLANPSGGDAVAAKLLADSPAIGAAISGSPATDFFGTARPHGARPDLGAHEYTGSQSVVRPAPPSTFQVQ